MGKATDAEGEQPAAAPVVEKLEQEQVREQEQKAGTADEQGEQHQEASGHSNGVTQEQPPKQSPGCSSTAAVDGNPEAPASGTGDGVSPSGQEVTAAAAPTIAKVAPPRGFTLVANRPIANVRRKPDAAASAAKKLKTDSQDMSYLAEMKKYQDRSCDGGSAHTRPLLK
eukprot:jgi/Chlat1/4016/Chrsp26S04081